MTALANSKLASACLVASSIASVCLAFSLSSGPAILGGRWGLFSRLAAWSVAWVVGVWAARQMDRRVAVGAVLVIGVIVRLAALSGPPVTSDDLYRYAWDGRVQNAGIDPYRSVPESHAEVGLHERWLWPSSAVCDTLRRPAGCTRINRPDVRTIYPPVAEAWFAVVSRLGGGNGSRHKPWQLAGLATELALLALLPLALRRWGHDERWVALYALAPFPILEVVNNGHVDGLAAAITVAALVVAGSRRDRAFLAGVLIGAAALVKLYPAIFVIALVGGAAVGRRPRPVVVAKAVAGAAAVSVAGYLPHVLVVGVRVIGYLPGYLREEHYTGGERFLLAGVLGLSGAAATAVAAAALAVVVVAVLVTRPAVPRGFAILLGGVLLVATPVQPWYAVTLLAVATTAAEPAWAGVAMAGYPYFFAVILDTPHAVGIGRVAYGAALACVLVNWRWQSSVRDAGDADRAAAVEATVAGRAAPRGEHRPGRPFGIGEEVEPAG